MWHIISRFNSSTLLRYAGDMMVQLMKYHSGYDVASGDDTNKVLINTETTFRTEKFNLRNGASGPKVQFIVPAYAGVEVTNDKVITYPAGLLAADEPVFASTPATFISKSIDAVTNILTNIKNANIASDAAILSSKLADAANFAFKNVANIFTAAQTIQVNTTFPLTIYRPINTQNASNVTNYNMQNSDSVQKTFAQQNILNASVVPGSEQGDYRVSVMQAGTLAQMFRVFNNNLYIGISPTQMIFDTSNISGSPKTFTTPNVSGRFVIQETTNTFTAFQKTSIDAVTHFLMHRPVNTVGANHGILFDAMSGAVTPVEIPYSAIYNFISANGSGVESGELSFQTRLAGSFVERMRLIGNTLRIGIASAALLFDPAGLTGVRTITSPDGSFKMLSEALVQTITNKVYDERQNTSLRQARIGRYSPSLETDVRGEGVLQGLQSYGTKATSTQNTSGKYDIWNTLAVTNAIAGVAKLDSFTCQRLSNPLVRFAFLYGGATTNRRVSKGIGPRRIVNMDSDSTPFNNNEPGIFIGYVDGVDTQWQVWHNDSSGTGTKDTTGINIPAVATNYIVEITAIDATPSFTVTFYSVTSGVRGSVIGTPLVITSDIPGQTTSLYLQDLIATKNGSVQANNIHYIEVGN